MRTSLVFSVGLALVSASCGGGSPGGKGIPAEVVGVHHRPATGNTSAHNLEILEDGTARWKADGCDFIEQSALRARRLENGEVELTAADGSPTFDFVTGQVPSIRVIADATGVRLTWGIVNESWPTGGVCATCMGGSLVPVGPPAACAQPF